MSRRVLFSTLIFASFILVTLAVILLAQGYRLDHTHLYGTGILAVQSNPTGAAVTVDGVAKGATNTNISDLLPGTYTVSVQKDGYAPWRQTVKVEQTKVFTILALLLPINPSLAPITSTSADQPLLSPDGQKLAYLVTTGSSAGIWWLDLSAEPFNLTRKPQQVVADSAVLAYSTGKLTWSPDSRELLDTLDNGLSSNSYLLAVDGSHEPQDVSSTATDVEQKWQQERGQSLLELSSDLNATGKQLSQQYASSLQWSPDNLKFSYSYQQDDQLIYSVYDKEAGTVTKTLSLPKNKFSVLRWYADSQHLLLLEKDSADATTGTVSFLGMDGSNKVQAFSGTLIEDALYSYLDGTKLVILTSFNQQTNVYYLYSINLR